MAGTKGFRGTELLLARPLSSKNEYRVLCRMNSPPFKAKVKAKRYWENPGIPKLNTLLLEPGFFYTQQG
jgi:hypothetical protein